MHVLKMISEVLVAFLTFSFSLSSNSPAVHLNDGVISGTYYSLPSGREIIAFFGIPYAAPPILENRFEPPKAVKPWIGVWNATVASSECLQLFFPNHFVIGDEDCLHLNVFTPGLTGDRNGKLMNVLVIFHGVTFSYGDANSYRPNAVLENHDMVVVTVNYRLGIIGFFSTGDTLVPGNNGLKDQTAALKWIRHNIIKFGGNPESVTILGINSGAASVQYHYLSQQSAGLFHKGISIDGTVLSPWALSRNNTERSFSIASQVGCPTETTRAMVECLRKRPGNHIMEAMNSFFTWNTSPYGVFGPVVEPEHADAFISQDPEELLEDQHVAKLPWMIVLSKDARMPIGYFLRNETHIKQLEDEWFDIAPDLLMFSNSVASTKEKKKISKAIRKFYFEDKKNSKFSSRKVLQMIYDRLILNGASRAARLHSAAVKEEVFCLKMDHRLSEGIPYSFMKFFHNYGLYNVDIPDYVINRFSSTDAKSEDDEVHEFVISLLAHFTDTGEVSKVDEAWNPILKYPRFYFRCFSVKDSKRQMIAFTNDKVPKFWEDLIPSEHPRKRTCKVFWTVYERSKISKNQRWYQLDAPV